MQRLFSLLIIWLSASFGLMAFAETAEDSDNAPIVYPRTVVYEKGTATWCGYCPVGSYVFDKLSQHHPEQFIGIAVHSNDEMTTHTYNDLRFRAYPQVHIDRNVRNASFYLEGFEEQFLTAAARPAAALVEASFKRTDERKFELTVRTTYGKDAHNLDLRLAYVVLEDSVGPYLQANYYSLKDFPPSILRANSTNGRNFPVAHAPISTMWRAKSTPTPTVCPVVFPPRSNAAYPTPSFSPIVTCRAVSDRSKTSTSPSSSSTIAAGASSMPPILRTAPSRG